VAVSSIRRKTEDPLGHARSKQDPENKQTVLKRQDERRGETGMTFANQEGSKQGGTQGRT